ncbi:MAG: 2-succinyl-5-enolpyruvyl-6-hydroxy-3-cyclohexene-1-carboxylic-acid synthase [candidate division Zixibacteria bacterium]|nr:2-succinyl-5-enolpyruvyl-6-hydroxy-3-cyclohexene-1-carboxylic-acid synthase [candidate division Zixibacteria bacterium]
MTTDAHNLLWARLTVEALRRCGIDQYVICPGSRTSPLILALSQESRVTRVVHQDERGAGYFAVGYARATGKAAAVVTTSGTAAVNLFPAIVEASMDNLPLIAITADRPSELHDCGANQTIDQVRLFGDYVRTFVDFPCPDDMADLTVPLTEIKQALDHALGQAHPVGPIHFNCRFREPLTPPPEATRSLDETVAEYPKLNHWLGLSSVPVGKQASRGELPSDAIEPFLQAVKESSHGLLLLGQLRNDVERLAALELIRKLNWPTLADITSGVHGVDSRQIVPHYDLLLASDRFCQSHVPDTILHVGGRITSKRLLQFIESSRPARYLHNSGDGLIFDPVRAVTVRTSFDNSAFCYAVARGLNTRMPDAAWLPGWRQAAQTVREKINRLCEGMSVLTEPMLAVSLSQRLDRRSGLFLASSMPIRDMDVFGMLDKCQPTAANRGASGIDGTIAAACGYAAGLNCPVTLLIGDQAFLYDLNSLALVSKSKHPVVIVVVNNNGGRIFELLPVSEHGHALEPMFIAPHNLTFGKIAEGFGIPSIETRAREVFDRAYTSALGGDRSMIIEATIDPAASRAHRSQILGAVTSELDSY